MRGQDFLAELCDEESVPEFLLDSTKMHAWVDGLEIRGQARFGVSPPHVEYDNISELVVGPRTFNMSEV